MKLYYIEQTHSEEPLSVFKPRIPENRMSGENATTPRICLSSSLEGCLSATPWGGHNLPTKGKSEIFRVYEFDTNDILEGNLILPYDLFSQNLVPDALVTEEHWVINQNLSPRNTYEILINDFELEELLLCENEELLKNIFNKLHFNTATHVKNIFYTECYDICYKNKLTIPYKKRLNSHLKEELASILYDNLSDNNYENVKVVQEKNKIKISWKYKHGFSYENLMSEIEEVLYE